MEKKLNIGLFIDTFYPMVDGVINVVDNYARNLCRDANVTVFAPKSRDKNFDDSVFPYRVIRCERVSLKALKLDYDLPIPLFDKKFKKEIKDANLDIIHIHSPFYIGKMGARYGRKHNIPVIATMHSQFEKDFYKSTKSKLITRGMLRIVAKTFNMCDVLWTMNPACVELSRDYGYKGDCEIVPNATNLVNEFSKEQISSFKKEICNKYNISNDERILINIGRLNKLKNIDFVIDVCKELKNKGFKFKLLLVGDGSDRNSFVSRVKKLDLENDIIFVGKVLDIKEKSKLFSVSDLQIFPSFYDTDGIVRIEAAAFSVPTIFIKNSIASSTIVNNVNGYIAENDKEKFAEKIINIFKEPDKFEKIKEQCYRDLYITWDKLIDSVKEKYLIQINKKLSNKK